MMKINPSLTDERISSELFERIEARRKQLKLTQMELAARLGVTAKTYRSLKHGRCSVLILILALRQLGLLENLEYLIPTEEPHPSQLWQRLAIQPTPTRSVKDMLAARKKLKVTDQ